MEKPPGILVHPTKPDSEPTLLEGLRALFCYEEAVWGGVSPIHRLDRETSGLLLVAKNRGAASALCQMMQNGEIRKEYLAVCFGWPREEEWETEGAIVKASQVGESKVWLRRMVHPAGKPARTRFRAVLRFERGGEKYALVLAEPLTGRTHQIRIHLAQSGLPVVGDKVYARGEEWFLHFLEKGNSKELLDSLKLPRQALHSFRLRFEFGGRRYDVRSVIPPDWGELMVGVRLPEGFEFGQ